MLPYRNHEGQQLHDDSTNEPELKLGNNVNCPYDPKKEMKGLNWSCRCVQRQYISTVEIENLRRNKATILCIESEGSKTFEKVIAGTDLFSVMDFFKNMKINEDSLLEKKNPAYNPAKRGFAKNILNSISGKPMTKLYTDTLKFFSNEAAFEK